MRLIIGCVLLALSAASHADDGWDSFWQSVKVSPSPPRDFLEGASIGHIQNLTGGRLSDDTAKAWVLADLRRSQGDAYAAINMRSDIAASGVFGPPGLNGTSDGIDALRRMGIVRLAGDQGLIYVSAAVIWMSPRQRREMPNLGLTEYVIVIAFRQKPGTQTFVYKDGHSEPVPDPMASIGLRWQLDTGHYFEHATLGPLWFQRRGWTCKPNDGTIVGAICGRLYP